MMLCAGRRVTAAIVRIDAQHAPADAPPRLTLADGRHVGGSELVARCVGRLCAAAGLFGADAYAATEATARPPARCGLLRIIMSDGW
jgi:hypothetical protein